MYISFKSNHFPTRECQIADTSGTLQRHVASTYRVSKQRFGAIISDVCKAICIELKDEVMPKLTTNDWTNIANDFNWKWNFPNVLGAINSNHIAI